MAGSQFIPPGQYIIGITPLDFTMQDSKFPPPSLQASAVTSITSTVGLPPATDGSGSKKRSLGDSRHTDSSTVTPGGILLIRADDAGPVKDDVSTANPSEVFIRGINKRATEESIIEHFSAAGQVLSLRWTSAPKSERKGHCKFFLLNEFVFNSFVKFLLVVCLLEGWIIYKSVDEADHAIISLNHSSLHGTNITIQKNTFSMQNSSVIPRQIRVVNIQEFETYNKRAKAPASVSYSRNGLMVNGVEYPTSHGNYLRKLLEKTHRAKPEDLPILDILLENTFGTNKQHTKELSESMAMVNGILKLGALTKQPWVEFASTDAAEERVIVYVLGDGKIPYTAMSIALFMPKHWKFVSIDPIMNFDPSLLGGDYAERIQAETKLSQDYTIPSYESLTARGIVTKSIVIACHSHAPLQEFWDRLTTPKSCISMPCCKAEWSHLNEAPLFEYEDYEVFSPKRLVKLYDLAE